MNEKLRTTILTVCMAYALASMNMSCFAQDSASAGVKKYGSPDRFEKAIQRFEAMDKKQPTTQGAIVCVGSSSMRGWHDTIQKDLHPLSVVPRGFGGSNMNDALHYADRIVLPYRPRAIVVYEGDNDIALGIAPKKVTDTFLAFCKKVHDTLPECRIYFLSIKPSISRWKLWPRMQAANRLIAAECIKDKRLTFVDVASGMLDDKGNPRKEVFKKDKLHMTRQGYEIWRKTLMPILVQAELQFEPKKQVEEREPNSSASNKPSGR
jgi:lysophospholipase L1-like esterase